MSGAPPPRQLTAEQRRQAEEDYARIQQLGEQYGIGSGRNSNHGEVQNGHRMGAKGKQYVTKSGMYSSTDTKMPTLMEQNVQGSRYQKPYFQSLFKRESRVIDIFDDEDYYNKDAKAVSSTNFSVQQVFQFYMAKVSQSKSSKSDFDQFVFLCCSNIATRRKPFLRCMCTIT